MKEIISKVDINKDGVLAAASARKLDKGGYVLQERARVARDAAGGFWMLNLPAGMSWFLKAGLRVLFWLPCGALRRARGSLSGLPPIRLVILLILLKCHGGQRPYMVRPGTLTLPLHLQLSTERSLTGCCGIFLFLKRHWGSGSVAPALGVEL